MLYFAYGSNLDPRQMRARCPTSTFVHRAVLRAHALAFTRWSPRRGCGVADVVPDPDAHVWGSVYALDEADVARLDACEVYVPGRAANGYERVSARVFVDGEAASPVDVMTYRVCERSPVPLTPSASYMEHLVSGAQHWGLPPGYVDALRAVEVLQFGADA